nr:hypothetical protein [Actinomycetota bacterium]
NGHTGGRIVTLAACLTFLPGALAGAMITFGGLAALGAALPGEAGWFSYGVAIALAVAAAAAEARGARIAPQIRRQLPEHWRRVMPMPAAAALYGILLGLGFTTFVLTFGVWALAGIALALGEPAAGLVLGIGFGLGRAIPIIALAPVADRPLGRRAVTLMAERPGLYRVIRLGDAAALTVAALALFGAAVAQAAVTFVPRASDPSADEDALAYARGVADRAVIDEGQGPVELTGTDPAISGAYVAVLDGDQVVILHRSSHEEADRFAATGVDAVSISGDWVAYRTRIERQDRIFARALGDSGRAGVPTLIDSIQDPAQLGLPALAGRRLVYAAAGRRSNRIVLYNLSQRQDRTLLFSRRNGLTNPSLLGGTLAYVRNRRGGDQLRLLRLRGLRDRSLISGDRRLWSTSLTSRRVYVTVLEGAAPRSRIISVRR